MSFLLTEPECSDSVSNDRTSSKVVFSCKKIEKETITDVFTNFLRIFFWKCSSFTLHALIISNRGMKISSICNGEKNVFVEFQFKYYIFQKKMSSLSKFWRRQTARRASGNWRFFVLFCFWKHWELSRIIDQAGWLSWAAKRNRGLSQTPVFRLVELKHARAQKCPNKWK